MIALQRQILSGLVCSSAGDRENTGGDLVSSRPAGADEMIGVILLVAIVMVAGPTTGVSVLEGTGKKLRFSVPSMCLCVCYVSSN